MLEEYEKYQVQKEREDAIEQERIEKQCAMVRDLDGTSMDFRGTHGVPPPSTPAPRRDPRGWTSHLGSRLEPQAGWRREKRQVTMAPLPPEIINKELARREAGERVKMAQKQKETDKMLLYEK